MSHSENIAALLGPVMCAIGVSLLFNRGEMTILASQLSDDYGLIFTSGVLLLVAGIAMARVHNVWSSDWHVAITIIAWVSIIGGLARILFFRQLADLAPNIAQWPVLLPFVAIILIAAGGFLTFKAYR